MRLAGGAFGPAQLTSATGVTNVGASALLTDIKSHGRRLVAAWFTGNNQLYFGSCATFQTNAWMINREQMPVMP